MLSNIFRALFIGVPIGVTVLDQVGYVARVEGISMQPALNPDVKTNDYVFLSKWAARNEGIQRGDVVSLVSPKNPNDKLIKRVIAVEGDYIDTLGYHKKIVRIPDGHCWIEGDHTGHTLDSNTFGPICLGLITGKATYIVWPPSRWQSISSQSPRTTLQKLF